VPVPEPDPEQVLVRIETCGLCHTDIHAARGDWRIQPPLPFIPRHEGVGIVERIGAGDNHGIEPGMRVALPRPGYACGDCAYCNSGRETLCEGQLNTGYSIDGAFAYDAVAFARHVVRVPEGIAPADASPLTCAGVTTYKAVKVAGVSSADLIAVSGVGGLGHPAVQYAAITGARVVAVDVNEQRLRTARRLGAEEVVHAGEEDPVAAIRRLGGAQAAISTAVPHGVRAGPRVARPRQDHRRVHRGRAGRRERRDRGRARRQRGHGAHRAAARLGAGRLRGAAARPRRHGGRRPRVRPHRRVRPRRRDRPADAPKRRDGRRAVTPGRAHTERVLRHLRPGVDPQAHT
jgi:hypothetical protein